MLQEIEAFCLGESEFSDKMHNIFFNIRNPIYKY